MRWACWASDRDSAGADPGPACYGRGGKAPTVTDADLLLGYLDADYFLGGKMRLNRGLAATAIEEGVAKPLAIDTIAAARSIYEVVNDNMANAASVYAAEQGIDLQGLHAAGLRRRRAGPCLRCSRASRHRRGPRSLGGWRAVGAGVPGFAGVVRLRLRLHARAEPSRLEQRQCPLSALWRRGPPASRRSRHPRTASPPASRPICAI